MTEALLERSRAAVGKMPKVIPQSWAAASLLAMMLASDYKLRIRSAEQTLSGTADFTILLEVLVYMAVAGFLALQFRQPPRLRRTQPVLFLAWGFSVTLAVSAVWAPYPGLAIVRGVQLVVTCALAQTIARNATRAHLHRLAHAFVVVVAASVVFGLVFPMPRLKLQTHRFNWLFVHPVIAGSYAGLAVVILVGYLVTRRQSTPGISWPQPVYWALLVLDLGGLLGTRTRGAIGGAAVGCLVVGLVVARRRARRDLIVVVVAAVALAVLVFGPQIAAYLERGESAQRISSLNSRTDLWGLAFELFARRPLFGFGLTSARSLFLDATGLGGAHNAFVNVLTDAGLLGSCWFVALIGAAIVAVRRLLRVPGVAKDACMIAAMIAFLLVDSMTTEGLATPANVSNVWLFAIVAWLVVLMRHGARTRRDEAFAAADEAVTEGLVPDVPPAPVRPLVPDVDRMAAKLAAPIDRMVQFTHRDGSITRLGAQSQFSLDSDPASGPVIVVRSGWSWHRVAAEPDSPAYEVRTPFGEIRPTTTSSFSVYCDPEAGCAVNVSSGGAKVVTVAGAIRILEAGDRITIDHGGLVSAMPSSATAAAAAAAPDGGGS